MPVSYPSPLFMPSRDPFRPAILPLPPLPYKLTTQGSAIIPPVLGTTRQDSQQTLRAASSLTSVLSTPSKRRPRMQDREVTVSPDVMHVDCSDSLPSSPTIAFEDLPRLECDWENLANGPEDQELLHSMYDVQPVMTPWMDVVRPQTIVDLTLPEYIPRPPPASMLYDAFVVLNNLQDVREEENDDEPASGVKSSPPTQGALGTMVTTGEKKNVPNPPS